MASVPFMPFLRPLLLPRVSYLRLLKRQISSCLHLEQNVTHHNRQKAAATATKSHSPSSPHSPPPLSKPVTLANPPLLPYHVHRTASQSLPIYHLAKRGGNLHQTRIRKIEGDIRALRDELQTKLGLKKENAVINQVTGHILLKGWFRDEVKRILEEKRF